MVKKVVKSRPRDAVAKPGAKRGGAKLVPTKSEALKRASVKRAGELKKGATKSAAPQRGAVNEKKRTSEPMADTRRHGKSGPDAAPFLGANQQRRTALGRGLSLLLSPNAVNIRPQHDAQFDPQAAQDAVAAREVIEANVIPASSATLESVDFEPPTFALPDEPIAPTLPPSLLQPPVFTPESNLALAPVAMDAFDEPVERSGAADPSSSDMEGQLRFVRIEEVIPSPTQPRKHFVQEELEALSRSIAESGLLQPLVVRRHPDGPARFEIVAGERRWRAAKLAGLAQVPVIVRELNDREALGLAIIENVQRSDLNPVEEAESYQRLIAEFGETQEGVAQLIGKDRVTITNALRLLRLAPVIRSLLVDGKLSAGHGRALLGLEDPVRQLHIAEQAVQEGLSVRAVEKLVSEGSAKRKQRRGEAVRSALPKSFNVVDIEDRMRRSLGTKVTLSLHSAESGEVRISFFSSAELENLLERIGA